MNEFSIENLFVVGISIKLKINDSSLSTSLLNNTVVTYNVSNHNIMYAGFTE